MIIGGEWADDYGRQVPGSGLYWDYTNTCTTSVSNVQTLNHPLDGWFLASKSTPSDNNINAVVATNLVAIGNGRQGMSVIGGRSFLFSSCKFNRTGRGQVASAPKAGVDLEPDTGFLVRNAVFVNCEAADNAGVGVLHGGGDVRGVTWRNGKIIGTTQFPLWPSCPNFLLKNSVVVGCIVNVYPGDGSTANASLKAIDCLLTDDPSLSPTGKVYVRNEFLLDFGGQDGPKFPEFLRCRVTCVDGTAWGWGGAKFTDCQFSQIPSLSTGLRQTANLYHCNFFWKYYLRRERELFEQQFLRYGICHWSR